MPLYKIYAGLGGGFGGAEYINTEEATNQQEAEMFAYSAACDAYESYSGDCGLFSREDELEENPDLSNEELDEMENEDRESWIEYYTVEVSDDNEEEE